MSETLLTRYGAAKYMGMSITWFARHIRPHIPNHGKPQAPRFKKEDIDAYVETKRVPPKVPRG